MTLKLSSYFFIEVHKIRRTTLLFTIILEACYLLKLGLNVEAEIQILNWKTDDKPRKWRDNLKWISNIIGRQLL